MDNENAHKPPRYAWWIVGVLVPISVAVLSAMLTRILSAPATNATPQAKTFATGRADLPANGHPSSPIATSAASPTKLGPYRNIQLGNLDSVDLTTDPPRGASNGDIMFSSRAGSNPAELVGDDMVIFPAKPAVTFPQCVTATRREDVVNVDDELTAGAQVCVIGKHHRVAVLTITRMPDPHDYYHAYIAFDAVIWQAPVP